MSHGSVLELLNHWTRRAEELRRLHALVDGAALLEEILTELRAAAARDNGAAVTLREASRLGGYSVDHLQRLVAAGALENVGRKHRPRIRQGDVPRKPGYVLPAADSQDYFPARRRIVASVLTGDST